MFEEQLPLLSTPTKFSSIYIELSILFLFIATEEVLILI